MKPWGGRASLCLRVEAEGKLLETFSRQAAGGRTFLPREQSPPHLEGRERVRPVDSLGTWWGEAGDGEVTEGQGETAGPGSQEGPQGGGEGL